MHDEAPVDDDVETPPPPDLVCAVTSEFPWLTELGEVKWQSYPNHQPARFIVGLEQGLTAGQIIQEEIPFRAIQIGHKTYEVAVYRNVPLVYYRTTDSETK